MFTAERKEQIEKNMLSVLGTGVILEWCGNTNLFMSQLIKGGATRPEDLEGQIALNLFFTELIKRYYEIDPVIMDLELDKCYRQMEKMIEDAEAAYMKKQEETKYIKDPFAKSQDATDTMNEMPDSVVTEDEPTDTEVYAQAPPDPIVIPHLPPDNIIAESPAPSIGSEG